MRLLILGGNGMAGHMLVQYFQKCSPYELFFTTRDKNFAGGLYLDAKDYASVEKMIDVVSPDIMINCIGILNEFAERNTLDAYLINGILPHQLQRAADKVNGRLIHISSDCVFSGEHGDHMEQDIPDGSTTYARTKELGEIKSDPHLTIRTSIIGPEVRECGIGLLHWFMQQEGNVKGYRHALWNGVTTLELAKFVHHVIEQPVSGLFHLVSPEKISKLELLRLFQTVFEIKNVTITPDESIRINRTLINTRKDVAYTVPGYETMLNELREWMRCG
jgi:dTDP-4-dehydrorhamnose reductase